MHGGHALALFARLGAVQAAPRPLTRGHAGPHPQRHDSDDERRDGRRHRRRVDRRRAHRRRGPRAGRLARRRRRSTPPAAWCCPASCRRTSICARRSFAVSPTTCRCSPGSRRASGRSKRRTTKATLRAAARLAAAELLLGGTTTVLTMETVHGTDAVFDALVPTGLRAIVGKCLMNVARRRAARGSGSPRATRSTRRLALHRRWHGAADGRLRAALAPRFAISCSRDLLEATAALSNERGLLVHTHASEQREEIDVVRARTGLDNVAYLASVGPRHRAAVRRALRVGDRRGTAPARRAAREGAPLPRVESQARIGHRAGHGDAARGDLGLARRRRRRVQQHPRHVSRDAARGDAAGDAARPGRAAGARRRADGHARRARMRSDSIARSASIEAGKRADLIVVATDGVHQVPGTDPYSTLVYACGPADVRVTMVDGEVVAESGQLDVGGLAGRRGRRRRQRAARCSRAPGCGDSPTPVPVILARVSTLIARLLAPVRNEHRPDGTATADSGAASSRSTSSRASPCRRPGSPNTARWACRRRPSATSWRGSRNTASSTSRIRRRDACRPIPAIACTSTGCSGRASGRARCLTSKRGCGAHGTVGDLLENASQELSRASHHIGFALAPAAPSAELRHIDFAPLDGHRVLVIVVATGGVDHASRDRHRGAARAEPARRMRPTTSIAEFAGLTLARGAQRHRRADASGAGAVRRAHVPRAATGASRPRRPRARGDAARPGRVVSGGRAARRIRRSRSHDGDAARALPDDRGEAPAHRAPQPLPGHRRAHHRHRVGAHVAGSARRSAWSPRRSTTARKPARSASSVRRACGISARFRSSRACRTRCRSSPRPCNEVERRKSRTDHD